MKASKHSRQQSDSATSSRRREALARNTLAQAQVYQQRLSNTAAAAAAYYSMPSTEADVYDAYDASAVLPQQPQYQQYHQQQTVDQQDLRRSASTGGWSMQEEQPQQFHHHHNLQHQHQHQHQHQQQLPPPQQQQPQKHKLYKQAEAKSLLEARHRPSSGAWSIRDDQQLITARSDGLNWSQIQERFFPSKSSNACRKRHERLIDSKGRGSDEAARMERIATHYVLMREKLWRPLADLTDEKWSFVEKTCLSSGLKNLQGVAKAANRRQRYDASAMAAAAAAAAAAGYDDDSGISGIGLTPVDETGTAASALAAYHSSPVPPSPHGGGGGGGGHSSGSDVVVGQSFASTTSQAASATTTTTAYLAHPHHLAQAHLHPAYTNIMYGGGGSATQYHPQHAYSSSISSEGSLHPGYVSRRGNESA
ncbi:myb family transcription factor [Beauveria brongniartii RCEF 3172]|uniref:Myb family transcription factor n=1 Tax=Beauveria brongniartii RCEF 3172 TaxID=1081107 RepID=A0A167FZ63_9HYPO|nr:myb family transcription factor [Beauveria brongniartii RCEF 3172]